MEEASTAASASWASCGSLRKAGSDAADADAASSRSKSGVDAQQRRKARILGGSKFSAFSASSDDFAKRKKNQLRHKETDYLGPPSSSSLFLSFVASSHVSSRSLHDAARDGRHLLCARGGADRKGRRTRSR